MTDPGPDTHGSRAPVSPASWRPELGRAAKIFLVVAGAGALLFILFRPPATTFPASPIDGVVVKVDSTGIGNVRGFTMRVAGGATLDLTLGTLENASQFAPGHLTEHQATATPVRAYFVVNGGIPVVYRLEDAPAASSSP